MNVLSIDYGTKNIGLAYNNGSSIAFPLRAILNNENIIEEISDIIDEEMIEKIIIGMPSKRDRSEGDLADRIRDFADELRSFGKSVEFEDELLSSSQAKDMMKGYQGKYEKDAVEAAVILQTYLDRND